MRLDPKRSLITNSATLADAVKLAYNHSAKPGLDWVVDRPFSCGEVQGRALVLRGGIGVLAIAGTNSVWDFCSNLQTKLKTVQGVYDLHSGFVKSAEVAIAAITNAIGYEEACWQDGNYFICGHSLGAATAAILPLLINQQSWLSQPTGVVAFGSPKYVQGPGSILWPCPVLHIQSRKDLVSHIPNGLFGVRPWARAGQQVYLDDRGFDCYEGHEVTRLIGYVRRLTRLDFLRGSVPSIAEHSMDLYAQRVKAGLIKLDQLTEKLANA
jgi:pimeloyl-ACP methyl ester carboxylesterase